MLAGRQGYIWGSNWGKVLKKWQRMKLVQAGYEKVVRKPEAILQSKMIMLKINILHV